MFANVVSLIFTSVFLITQYKFYIMFLSLTFIPVFKLLSMWRVLAIVIGKEDNTPIIEQVSLSLFYRQVIFQFDIMTLLLALAIIPSSFYIITLGHNIIGTIIMLPTCFLPGLFLYTTSKLKTITNTN